MVEVSVVVPTLKSREELPVVRCLEKSPYEDFEVVIRQDYPVCKARNEGIKQAVADKIVFLDDDSLPADDYLEKAAEILDEEAAFAGRSIHPRDDIFKHHFTSHYDRGSTPHYVDTFWGHNMGIRREVFHAVGGWDEQMGWGHEEKELAARVRQKFKIRYDPDLVVTHPYSDSILEYWKKHYKLETQSPYYWRKQGLSMRDQLEETLREALYPPNYVRRGVVPTVVQTGALLAKTLGRFSGLLDLRRSKQDIGDLDAGVPRFGGDTESVEVPVSE